MQIHAVHTISTIALYREYVPFTPFGLTEPKGPLDEPRIKEEKPEEELRKYWIEQARFLFGAARDFADLLGACQSANVEIDALCVGFTTYTVAWCGELDTCLFSLLD